MATNERTVVGKFTITEFMEDQRQQHPSAKMKVAHFTDSEGTPFTSLAITERQANGLDKTLCLISFSEQTGEMTAKEIAEQKAELQVLCFSDGKYKLIKSQDTWEEVDI